MNKEQQFLAHVRNKPMTLKDLEKAARMFGLKGVRVNRVTRRITGYTPQALYDGIYGGEAFWVYRIWV